MLEQIRGRVRSLDQRHGREYDEQSERISHSLLALAKDKGLARIDHVVLSGKSEFVRSPGQNIFVVQGKLEDPAHIRAHMDTGLAARTPVPESSLNLERSEEHTSELQSLMRSTYAGFCLKK